MNIAQTALGSSSIGFLEKGMINSRNPASYSYMETTSFNVVLGSLGKTFSSTAGQQSSRFGNIQQMNLGFPLGKRGGLTFGLLPYSDVSYLSQLEQNVPGFGRADVIYEGRGGIREFYAGTGWKVLSNGTHETSIGVNVRVLFGEIETYNTILDRNEQTFGFSSSSQKITAGKGTGFMLSATHKMSWNNDNHQIVLGAALEPGISIDGSTDIFTYTFSGGTTSGAVQDTLFSATTNAVANLPTKITFGGSYRLNKRWLFLADGFSQPWSQAAISFIGDPLSDAFGGHLGVQFAPGTDDYGKFFQRMQYRVGLHNTTGYVAPYNSQFQDFGMSFGLGIPLRASKSSSAIDIAFEFGERATDRAGLIDEQYTNIWIGFSFSPHKFDRWFVRPKIN
jgi:hypothetical protein